MDQPLRLGRNGILNSGAKCVGRNDHILIMVAPGEAPVGSDVDPVVDVGKGGTSWTSLGAISAEKAFDRFLQLPLDLIPLEGPSHPWHGIRLCIPEIS